MPPTYYKTIQSSDGLHNDPVLLRKVVLIAIKNVRFFVKTLYARQNFLTHFASCSCPISHLVSNVIPHGWGLNVDLNTSVEELVNIYKDGMKYSKKLADAAKTISIKCPQSETCLEKTNAKFMDIVTGKEDSIILDSFWQHYLPTSYPKIFEPLYGTNVIAPFQKTCSDFLDLYSSHPFSSLAYSHYTPYHIHQYPFFTGYLNGYKHPFNEIYNFVNPFNYNSFFTDKDFNLDYNPLFYKFSESYPTEMKLQHIRTPFNFASINPFFPYADYPFFNNYYAAAPFQMYNMLYKMGYGRMSYPFMYSHFPFSYKKDDMEKPFHVETPMRIQRAAEPTSPTSTATPSSSS